MKEGEVFNYILEDTERTFKKCRVSKNPMNRQVFTQDIVRAVSIEMEANSKGVEISEDTWKKIGLWGAIQYIKRSHNSLKRALAICQKFNLETKESWKVEWQNKE